MPGAHFVEHDEVNEEDGSHLINVFWYSKDHVFFTMFTAEKDSPDDFGLMMTGALPKDAGEEENN